MKHVFYLDTEVSILTLQDVNRSGILNNITQLEIHITKNVKEITIDFPIEYLRLSGSNNVVHLNYNHGEIKILCLEEVYVVIGDIVKYTIEDNFRITPNVFNDANNTNFKNLLQFNDYLIILDTGEMLTIGDTLHYSEYIDFEKVSTLKPLLPHLI